MRKIFICLSLAFIWVSLVFNSSAADDAQPKKATIYTGIVTGNAVNVRSGPGLNFEILKKMDSEELVLVLDQEQDWYKIKVPRDSNAYVYKDFISPRNAWQAIICGSRVNVRAGKGKNFNILGQLNKNDKIELIGKEGDWYKIFPAKACFAWVNKKYVKYHGQPKFYLDYQKSLRLLKQAGRLEKRELSKKNTDRNLNLVLQKYQNIAQTYSQGLPLKMAKHHINRLKGKISKSNQDKKQIPAQPNGQPQGKGKIIELGRYLNRVGTHKLIKDKKTIYYLKSDALNLDDYIYHQVYVWGKIKKSEKSKISVIEVEYLKKLN